MKKPSPVRAALMIGAAVVGAPQVLAHAERGAQAVAPAASATPEQDPDARAAATLAQMTLDEKLSLLRGYLTPRVPVEDRPEGITVGAGFVPGVPRLGIPPLVESDASLGVANMGGFMRRGDEATAMPSGLAMASTWNPDLIEEAGEVMGAEARAKGFNVLLAGGINLVRDPRAGRNFEYLGEDPLLSGTLAGHSIRGIQSNNIVSTIKHFALNNQETGRLFVDVRMDEADMRESDLLAFQIAIEEGQPGAVMCSYNRVGGEYACENEFLLNEVLREDWDYKGWVLSDWGSVHSPSIREGLDQESGTTPGEKNFFGEPLRQALAAGTVSEADIDRSVLRILRSMYAVGVADNPVSAGRPIDVESSLAVAQKVAEQGIVLLKNEGGLLPLANRAQTILVVGGHADVGVPQGGGSSQVWPVGGASLSLAIEGDAVYHRRLYMPSAPVAALQEQFPQANVIFDHGSDPARAAALARQADVAIVFGEQFMAEGHDAPDLNLPDGQNQLIDAVASANPRTAVVLETGNPVLMPWLNKVGAVVQAWYPGNRGGAAIARVLSGAVNPSGHLPVTFPASAEQLPNPVVPGSELEIEGNHGLYDLPEEDRTYEITYPEGSDVGYRWFARKDLEPLFPFGHGLSYTSFTTSGIKAQGTRIAFDLTNTGDRAGTEVAQLYLVSRNGEEMRRLVGFQRVELAPGETRRVVLDIDKRLIAEWENDGWVVPGGEYRFAVAENAEDPGKTVTIRLPEEKWEE